MLEDKIQYLNNVTPFDENNKEPLNAFKLLSTDNVRKMFKGYLFVLDI